MYCTWKKSSVLTQMFLFTTVYSTVKPVLTCSVCLFGVKKSRLPSAGHHASCHFTHNFNSPSTAVKIWTFKTEYEMTIKDTGSGLESLFNCITKYQHCHNMVSILEVQRQTLQNNWGDTIFFLFKFPSFLSAKEWSFQIVSCYSLVTTRSSHFPAVWAQSRPPEHSLWGGCIFTSWWHKRADLEHLLN